MIITSTTIELSRSQKLIIVPLGDIHFNAANHDRERFTDSIAWIKETAMRPDRVIRVKLMGDELDTVSRREFRAYQGADLHSTTRERVEDMITDDLGLFLKAIEPIAPYIDSVICGNHTFVYQERKSGAFVGKSTSQIIAETIGAPFLGICGMQAVQLHRPGSTEKFIFKIFMHHGFGQAQTKPASIMQMLKLREKFPAMNLYIMGHNHVKIATTSSGIDLRKNAKRHGAWEMCSFPQAFVRSASFQKGYVEGVAVVPGRGSYVEEHCMAPHDLGLVTANVRWVLDEHRSPKGYVIRVQE